MQSRVVRTHAALLPADPVGWDAVQSKQSELEVVCGSRSFSAALLLGRRRSRGGAEADGGRTEGAQVELDQVVHGLAQLGHALLHRDAGTWRQRENSFRTECLQKQPEEHLHWVQAPDRTIG